jgi:hypothetical protein
VVGVADSPSGLAAVAAGVREAALRQVSVRLVRVWRDIGWLFSMTLADVKRLPASEQADQRLLAAAAAYAHTVDPAVTVETEFLTGGLYNQLYGEAGRAQLLVLGAGNEATGLVADWFTRHRPSGGCPVLTVNPPLNQLPDSQCLETPARDRQGGGVTAAATSDITAPSPPSDPIATRPAQHSTVGSVSGAR